MSEFIRNYQGLLLSCCVLIVILILYKALNITAKTLFKGILYRDRFWFITSFVLIFCQLVFLESETNSVIYIICTMYSGLISTGSLIYLFSKKIDNIDFTVVVGIFILMQSALSMLISSKFNDNDYNVSLIHAMIYIGLPSFLLFEIDKKRKQASKNNNSKEISESNIDSVKFIFKLVETFNHREKK
ncbi:hypothetical protein ACFFHK_05790 [Gallibacterium trehalosifermentans]|uniref:Uncharacterized protein n=1 Tax=Gallibacterium trehalosifermentans TaxID=516935 RepID=A0ABV6H0R1_9PAST